MDIYMVSQCNLDMYAPIKSPELALFIIYSILTFRTPFKRTVNNCARY